MEIIAFTPTRNLDSSLAPASVTVKGCLPRHSYSFNLLDLYPQVPSLDVRSAYNIIKRYADRIDDLLTRHLHKRASRRLPGAASEREAVVLFGVLLDPTQQIVMARSALPSVRTPQRYPHPLGVTRPFPLEQASEGKLLHTLRWIDTNVKVRIEESGAAHQIPLQAISDIVYAVLFVYCVIVKMADHRLARSMNFNYSMFLQDRIIQLLLGDDLVTATAERGSASTQGVATLSNAIALELLRGQGPLSYRQLCMLSVFMG